MLEQNAWAIVNSDKRQLIHMIPFWVGVDAAGLPYCESGMNAMKNLMRSLIAVPIIAASLIYGDVSVAAVSSVNHKASADTKLSKVGFLDFKTLLYSPSPGDNLDGVFNQIKFIGPEMFINAALPPGVLRKFKRRQRPLLPANPLWGWDESDLDLLDLDVNGKSLPISSGLADAILTDISDNIRNHGVSWMPIPAIGPGTTAYFKSATQNVINQIKLLENLAPTRPAISQSADATKPVMNIAHLQLVFLFGLGLVMIGLLRRRSRKKTPQTNRNADPAACFDAIQSSPIRYAPKTV